VGPKPTKQVQPRVPPGNVGVGLAQIQVRLAINTKGKVTKVTLLGTTPDPVLMVEVNKAASGWEFEPARLNGQPVPSEMNLIFHFR
jgi:TonB family protein